MKWFVSLLLLTVGAFAQEPKAVLYQINCKVSYEGGNYQASSPVFEMAKASSGSTNATVEFAEFMVGAWVSKSPEPKLTMSLFKGNPQTGGINTIYVTGLLPESRRVGEATTFSGINFIGSEGHRANYSCDLTRIQ